MLTPFGTDLWLCDGPAITGAAGFRFPTRMAIIRLPESGGIWVWSPVALNNEIRAAIERIGPILYLVAPNGLHYSFLAEWTTTFPGAQVHAAPGLTPEITGTPIHATLWETADPAWAGQIEQVILTGNRITTEVIFFHRASGTVLITDMIQQIPEGWFSGWRTIVARLDLMTAPVPSVPRKFRLAMRDKATAREAVLRMLKWPAVRLVMAHGTPVSTGADATLKQAFEWLLR